MRTADRRPFRHTMTLPSAARQSGRLIERCRNDLGFLPDW
jgi:hypothetical protein